MLELVRGMGPRTPPARQSRSTASAKTFRRWAAECSVHRGEVAEHELAHRLPDKVEASYRRGTMLEKRRSLMTDWGKFIDTVTKKAG